MATWHLAGTAASSRASPAIFDLGVECAAQQLGTLVCPTHPDVEPAGFLVASSACCRFAVLVQHHLSRISDRLQLVCCYSSEPSAVECTLVKS